MRIETSLKTKVLALLVGLAVVTGLILSLAPWTVSSDALREAVSDQLERELGVSFAEAERTTIAFLPTPRVKFERVILRTSDGTELVRGGALRGQLAWGPLIYGRIRLTDVSLSQARILVPVDHAGRSPWDGMIARLGERAGGAEGETVDSLTLFQTTFVYSNAATSSREVVRDANLKLRWPDPNGPMSVTGSAGVRGEIVDIALSGLSPAVVATGARSPIDLRLSGRLGRLSVVGTVATGRDSPWLVGRVSMDSQAGRDVLAWSGATLPLGPLIGPIALQGDANGVGRALSLSGLQMTVGGDRLDGALTARMTDGRLSISGTFAAETLDMTPFAEPILTSSDPGSPQRRMPLSLTRHTTADLDLRLSAAAARIGRVRLSDVAMSLIVSRGRVETSLSRARLAGGELRGRFALAEENGMVGLRLEAEGERLDLAALGRDLGGQRIGGTGMIEIALTGAGADVDSLIADVQGSASIDVGAGEFVGVDLAEALRRFERRPLTATQTLRSGRTPFQAASGRLEIEDGVGRIEDATFESPQLSGVLEGAVSLRNRRIDAKAAVESATPVGEGNLISALTFAFEGPLTNVSLVPDAKALIQRSGAARLLLGTSVDGSGGSAPGPQIEPAASRN